MSSFLRAMTSSVAELFPELLAERKPLKKPPVGRSGLAAAEADSSERRLAEGGILGRALSKAGGGWKGGMTGCRVSDALVCFDPA